MDSSKPFHDFDSYLALQTEDNRNELERIRQLIRSIAPKAEECISYGMPSFKYYGYLISIAAFSNHLSIFPGAIVEQFKDELKGFKTSKGTIQFSLEHPIPNELFVRIVKAGMKRNEGNRGKMG